MDLSYEKGFSIWLTTIPIKEFGFFFHKSDFIEPLTLLYNWQSSRLPTHCSCGEAFLVDHALSCFKVASLPFVITRFGTANLLTEDCNKVLVKPDLQPAQVQNLMNLQIIQYPYYPATDVMRH